VRWYHGTFTLDRGRVRLPTAAGCAPLWLRLDRDIPYPVEQVRSVTLLCEGGRLWLEITAELPVATYPEGEGSVGSPIRVAASPPMRTLSNWRHCRSIGSRASTHAAVAIARQTGVSRVTPMAIVPTPATPLYRRAK
jgi:hypothetical protein